MQAKKNNGSLKNNDPDETDREELVKENMLLANKVKFLERILDSMPANVLVTNENGIIEYCNKTAAGNLKAEREELKGQDINILGEDRLHGSSQREIIEKTLAEGNWYGFINNYDKNGKEITFETRTTYLKDIDKTKSLLIGVSIDVTDRLENEKKLEKYNRINKIAGRFGKIGIFEYHFNSKNTELSDEGFNILGITDKDRYKTVDDFKSIIHPEDLDVFLEQKEKSVNERKEFRVIFRSEMPGQKLKWISAAGNFIYDNNGKPLYLIGVLKDITEFKDVEKKLTDNEEFLKKIIENIPVGIFVKDVNDDFRFTYWNPRLEQITGVPGSFAVGKNDYDITPADEADYYRETDEKVIRARLILDIPLERITTVNGLLDCRTIKVPVYDKDGNPDMLIGIIEDISGKIKAIEAVKTAEERLKNFIESVDDLVYFIDTDGCMTLYNFKNIEKLGFDPNKLHTNPKVWEKYIHRDDLSYFINISNDLHGGRDYYEHDYRLTLYSGSVRYYHSKKFAVRSQDGSLIGYNCIDRDITKLKSAERKIVEINKELEDRVRIRTEQLEELIEKINIENEERKKAQAALSEANNEIEKMLAKERKLSDMKSKFIRMVSHEYRTPMTVILSSAHLLKRLYKSGDDEKFDNHIGKIQKSVQQMTELLNNIISIRDSDLNNLNIKAVEFNLIDIVAEVTDSLADINNQSHYIDFRTGNNELLIESDEHLIRQIIRNILSNAMKFSPVGSTISIEILDLGNDIAVTIKDSGLGIPESEKENIFEPFHKSGRTENISGIGLGLSIARNAVEALNGKINLESREYAGTKFGVVLPKKYRQRFRDKNS